MDIIEGRYLILSPLVVTECRFDFSSFEASMSIENLLSDSLLISFQMSQDCLLPPFCQILILSSVLLRCAASS